MSATVWNCFPESPTATTLLTSWPGAGGKAVLGCGGRRYLGGSGLAVWILCTDDPCFDIALVWTVSTHTDLMTLASLVLFVIAVASMLSSATDCKIFKLDTLNYYFRQLEIKGLGFRQIVRTSFWQSYNIYALEASKLNTVSLNGRYTLPIVW